MKNNTKAIIQEIEQEIANFLVSHSNKKYFTDAVETILSKNKKLSIIFNYLINYCYDTCGKNTVGVDVYLQEEKDKQFLLTTFMAVKH